MSTTGRPDLRSPNVRRRRTSFLKGHPQRRLRAEQLEPRTMLAGDLPHTAPSEYWNYVRPTDINDDGRESSVDLLILINALTQTGPRNLVPTATLAAPSASTGEGEDAVVERFYIDPNNDGKLNAMDLLTVVNEMSAEGEDPPIIVRYSFVPVIAGTNTPLTAIPEGGHYELRVMVQDTGVTSFMGDTRNLNEVGVASSFLDMFWDRTQTDVQVNETQTLVIAPSPTTATRFRLTFTDTDNTTQTTAPIAFATDREVTAVNIRNALVALSKIGNSAVGALPNIEVVPSTANNRTFTIRFIHDEANKNFIDLSAALTVAGGASGITITETVAGDPNSLVSFQEMFRPRPVRNASFDIINDDINDELYYDVYFGQGRPFSTPQGTNTIRNAGADLDFFAIANGGPRPLQQDVEVFRLRMTAKESAGTGLVTFSGAYPQIGSGLSVLVLGDATGGGPFSTALPAATVQYVSGNITIQEPVSAVDDLTATVNEGTTAANLNSVLINVLANDLDTVAPFDLEIISTSIGAGQGTVEIMPPNPAPGGINRPHLRYRVPNADFNGIVDFQYTIRNGTGTPVSSRPTDTGNVRVTVAPINDAPVNSIGGSTNFASQPQTVAEDAPAGLVFGGANAISISDVDAGAASVSIRLVSTNGTLTMVAPLPGTIGNGTNDLTIVGSIADINPALSGLKYTPNLNYNGSAQITVTTNDQGNTGGGALSDTDVIVINVTATNDGPVNTVPAVQTVDEAATLTFNAANGNLISVADVDADAGTVPSLTVTLSTSQGGVINAAAGSGASVTPSGTTNTSLTISGTVAQVNAALNGLTYRNANPASDVLTVLTSDRGNTGTGGILTDSDPIAINVLPTNRPRAIADVVPTGPAIQEGVAFIDLDVLLNDLTNLGETPLIDSISLPVGFEGTVIEVPANGTIPREHLRFTPVNADYFGTQTFSYTMIETDNVPPGGTQLPNSGPSTTTVTVTITNVNDAPVGVADDYDTNEDQPLIVSAALGVLSNDTDADNRPGKPIVDTLTAQLVANTPAAAGSVSLSADGSFTFTPAANFNGQTSFTYRVFDGTVASANTTVTIDVAPLNDNPVANPDSYPATEDVVLTVNAANGVLANDTDVDNPGNTNAGLTATLTQQPPVGQGTVSLASDGSFTWTPTAGANFFGSTTFKYRAVDSTALQSPEATVTIVVAAVNDPPVAGDTEFFVEEGQILSRTAANGLRTSVTDPDQPAGFTGSIALVSGPAQGSLTLNVDGSFSYTPPATVVNPFDVTFTYTATDSSQATSNIGTVTIHVTPFNDPPVAVADGPYDATEDQVLTVSALEGVIPNDSDEETPDSGLTAILVSNVAAAAGSVVLNADGSFTYTPAPDFFTQPKATNTPISFSYQVSDGPVGSGGKLSNVVTVTINVDEVNDNPVANPDLADSVIRNFLNQLLPSALANDNSGVDTGVNPAEVLSIISVDATTAAGNTVTRVGNDLFYNDNIGHVGQDTFEYTISDGNGGTATATYTVNVVEFIPKDISGTVFVDADNDGVFDPGERAIAGVTVNLNGTNVLGLGTVTDSTTTDEFGRYSFDDLRPGNYTVSEQTPEFFRDGSEPSSHSSSLVRAIANDLFTLRWDTPESIATGGITGLNFGERGIDAAQLDNASGLLSEILASSGSSGMVLAVGPGGNVYWSYCLNGWSTKATLQLEFGAGGSIPSLLLTIGGVTRRIYQNPGQNTGTGSPQSPPAGSTARFRILGSTNSGEYIIRLDGTLSDFGFVASTGAPSEAGEGEYAPEMSDGDFRDSADQVFANEAWA